MFNWVRSSSEVNDYSSVIDLINFGADLVFLLNPTGMIEYNEQMHVLLLKSVTSLVLTGPATPVKHYCTVRFLSCYSVHWSNKKNSYYRLWFKKKKKDFHKLHASTLLRIRKNSYTHQSILIVLDEDVQNYKVLWTQVTSLMNKILCFNFWTLQKWSQPVYSPVQIYFAWTDEHLPRMQTPIKIPEACRGKMGFEMF